ncbi:hypothetical protein [Glutamicibacter sp.]|uniref:hypothetical protein n=1 Tax=Glutamicibacter sp. TaxID=1931995 RepID=UPI0028BE6ACE|nr:hypothetical protein [Glutamicibacter sp.]
MNAAFSERSSASLTQASIGARVRSDPSFSAFWILRLGFVVLPLLMGVDKFTNVMTYWPAYLSDWVVGLLPFSAQTAMYIVGVVEIIAAIGIAVKPRYSSYVVALWLLGIVVNLLLLGGVLDIALRDVGLFVAALALTRLAAQYDAPWGAKHAQGGRK